MNYLLVKRGIISKGYSMEYLQNHIIPSLNNFFLTHNDEEIEECQKEYGYSNNNLPMIWINDVADPNCMLMFEITNKIGSYIRLSFLGRFKG